MPSRHAALNCSVVETLFLLLLLLAVCPISMGSTGGALTARDLPLSFLHDVHVAPEEVDAAISVPAAYIILFV